MMAASMIVAAGCGNNSGTGSESQGADSTSGGDSAEKSYQIAISQIVEHPSLDATREGFIAALKDAGIEENKTSRLITTMHKEIPRITCRLHRKLRVIPRTILCSGLLHHPLWLSRNK